MREYISVNQARHVGARRIAARRAPQGSWYTAYSRISCHTFQGRPPPASAMHAVIPRDAAQRVRGGSGADDRHARRWPRRTDTWHHVALRAGQGSGGVRRSTRGRAGGQANWSREGRFVSFVGYHDYKLVHAAAASTTVVQRQQCLTNLWACVPSWICAPSFDKWALSPWSTLWWSWRCASHTRVGRQGPCNSQQGQFDAADAGSYFAVAGHARRADGRRACASR